MMMMMFDCGHAGETGQRQRWQFSDKRRGEVSAEVAVQFEQPLLDWTSSTQTIPQQQQPISSPLKVLTSPAHPCGGLATSSFLGYFSRVVSPPSAMWPTQYPSFVLFPFRPVPISFFLTFPLSPSSQFLQCTSSLEYVFLRRKTTRIWTQIPF